MKTQSTITAIVCTKNEEKTISGILKSVKKYVDEILVVDGHSLDRTRELAKKSGATRVVLDNGRGKGAAIRLGISKAKGDILVFIDADGSHIPSDIPRLVKPILKNRCDMVVGSRMTGGSEELHGTVGEFFRLFASSIVTLIIDIRFGATITDSQNGFRAIRKRAARKLDLKADKFDIEEEMTMKCLKRGFRIEEVPSMELKRKFGESNINLWKMWPTYAWRVFVNLF